MSSSKFCDNSKASPQITPRIIQLNHLQCIVFLTRDLAFFLQVPKTQLLATKIASFLFGVAQYSRIKLLRIWASLVCLFGIELKAEIQSANFLSIVVCVCMIVVPWYHNINIGIFGTMVPLFIYPIIQIKPW